MKDAYVLIAVILLIGVGVTSLVASVQAGDYLGPARGGFGGQQASGGAGWTGNYGSPSFAAGTGMGMMGGRFGVGEGLGTMTVSQSLRLLHQVLPGTVAFPSNDSVVVYSSHPDLLVFTMGHQRAINLTGATPPAYATHDVFVVDGLIDPTLVLEDPSTVNVTTVNLDSSMYHNFVVTRASPPYPYNTMPYEMGFGMVPFLPPAQYSAGQAFTYSYSMQVGPGNYWYLCTYPGHAEMGMYGQLVVR